MLRVLRYVFLAVALIGSLVGLALVAAPGRFMALVGWPNLDPILYRVLGAAVFALAWSAFRGAQAQEPRTAQPYVDMQAIFSGLAAIGVWRHLLSGAFYETYVWALAIILTVLTIVWIAFWVMLVLAPTTYVRSGTPSIRVR